uniref:hypothetical protein n=1 Tax=Thaumasiovibrio occultus TaxID=1891184 RepID=UPI00131C59D9|nr:hypothetical protein [Thaumasiovibrio occultus]
MRKRLLASTATLLVLSGMYFAVSQTGLSHRLSDSPNHDDKLLRYIPADTPVFGSLHPLSAPNDHHVRSRHLLSDNRLDAIIPFANTSSVGTRENNAFIHALLSDFVHHIEAPEQLFSRIGLSTKDPAYFYSLGIVPVAKFIVTDEVLFWQYIDDKGQNAQFEQQQLGDIAYRSYTLDNRPDKEVEAIIAVHDDIATLTFNYAVLNAEQNAASTLALAIGQEKLTDSMADNNTQAQLKQQYPLAHQGVSYIDFTHIAGAVTQADNSLLAQHLAANLAANNNSHQQRLFRQITTPECQRDIGAIAQQWPRAVLSYGSFENNFQTNLTIESEHTVIMDALTAMVGQTPDFVSDHGYTFNLALGLKGDNIVSSLDSIFGAIKAPTLSCAPLNELQQAFRSVDKGFHYTAGPFVAGFEGISISVDVDAPNDEPLFLADVDAVLAVTADDPLRWMRTYSAFEPKMIDALNLMQSVDNGQEVEITEIIEEQQPHYAALYDNTLFVYAGPQSTALVRSSGANFTPARNLFSASIDAGAVYRAWQEIYGLTKDTSNTQIHATKPRQMPDFTLSLMIGVNASGISIDTQAHY